MKCLCGMKKLGLITVNYKRSIQCDWFFKNNSIKTNQSSKRFKFLLFLNIEIKKIWRKSFLDAYLKQKKSSPYFILLQKEEIYC